MANPYTAAKSELAALRKQKEELDAKIEAVTKTVKMLEPFYRAIELAEAQAFEEVRKMLTPEAGITERIRAILRRYEEDNPVWPTEVRDELLATGFDGSARSNLMAEVHTVLKRLVESGHAEVGSDQSGMTIYWSAIGRQLEDGIATVINAKQRKRRRKRIAKRRSEVGTETKPAQQ